jgi:hypothetical protein
MTEYYRLSRKFSNKFHRIFFLSKIKENRRKQEILNKPFLDKNRITWMDMFKILIEKQWLKKRLYLEVFAILITIKFNKTK